MRPSLRIALGLTVFSSAVDLLSPAQSTVGARLDNFVQSPSAAPATSTSAQMPTIAATQSLSSALARVNLEATTFDPFGGFVPPAPTPAPVIAAAPIPAPPPAVPPALTYRFLGRMIDPSGQQQIYLSHGDSNIVAAVGTALEDGYVIDSITDDAIALHHPPTDTHVLLPIPPAGDSAPR